MTQQRVTHMTRPPAIASAGRVTIQEAADALGMTYSGVYHHVKKNTVPFEQDDKSGVITFARADLVKLRKARRQPANGDKRGIFLRPTAETAKRWERAIKANTKKGETPITVARWLVELAELACVAAGV